MPPSPRAGGDRAENPPHAGDAAISERQRLSSLIIFLRLVPQFAPSEDCRGATARRISNARVTLPAIGCELPRMSSVAALS